MATTAQENLPPPLDSKAELPPLFDGTPRLYISYSCPFAQRAWITRNYKGLQDKIKLVPLNLQDRPAWYKEKVYPVNKVPALEHNGKVIGESLDLIKYVDSNFEGPSLLPDDPEKRKFADELFSHIDTFTNDVYTSFKGDPAKQAGPAFDYLEKALDKFDDGPFFLGQFSQVDIAYIPFVERFQIFLSEEFKYDITAGRPKLAAWIEELNKLDAYKSTKADPKQLVEFYRSRFVGPAVNLQSVRLEAALNQLWPWFCEISVYENLPPVFDSKSEQPPPPLFDGTTRDYKIGDISLVAFESQRKPVPSLEHNGKIIGESLDLINYVDSNFEGPSLLPDDPEKRKFAEELFSYSDTFIKDVSTSFKGDTAKEAGPAFDFLEKALDKFDDGPFFLGQFSLVDIAYIPFVDGYQMILSEGFKYDATIGRPKLAAWIEELNKMDVYKQTKYFKDPKQLFEYYRIRFLIASRDSTEQKAYKKSTRKKVNAMATVVHENLPPVLDSKSEQPPSVFDGTTRLYMAYTCPFAQRVWITRNYKGLQDEIKLVAISLEDKPVWYKEKVHPANKVPALEHNGKIVGESLDLIKYVDSNFEGPSLLPDDPEKRKFAEELFSYSDTFNITVYGSFKGDPAKEAGPCFDYLEKALHKFDDGPFLLGQLSLVDIAYIPFVERAQIFLSEVIKYDITAGRPKLAAWIEELNQVDAYKQTKLKDPKGLVELYKIRYM
ncbi:hypothetical protein CUMW_204580 [Citrus unshiu]|nr:hypothetical protein CUMW_204580 [Citrus unshiu]